MRNLAAILALAALAACGPGEDRMDEPAPADETPQPGGTAGEETGRAAAGETFVIEPGLTARILEQGSGQEATPGQTAVVHYTGWLYDPEAPDNRGEKFDSSVDRGQHFRFPLGGGRVIAGWDRGVAGMKIGEVRELTIAPELAYGERGAGDAIPPGATLVFEVELAGLEGGA